MLQLYNMKGVQENQNFKDQKSIMGIMCIIILIIHTIITQIKSTIWVLEDIYL